jgi:LuxR family maltose regulon positive regulatory protein
LGPWASDVRQLLNQIVLGFCRCVLGSRSIALASLIAARDVNDLLCLDLLLAEAIEQPVTLFIDNAEHLGPESAGLVEHLIRNGPEGFRTYLSSRVAAKLDTIGLMASDLVVDICAKDLAFTYKQTEKLVRDALGVPVLASLVECIHEASEGWPIAINLGIQAVRQLGQYNASPGFHRRWERLLDEYIVKHAFELLTDDQIRYLGTAAHFDVFDDTIVQIAGYQGHVKAAINLANDGVPMVRTTNEGDLFRLVPCVRSYLARQRHTDASKLNADIYRAAALHLKSHCPPSLSIKLLLKVGELEQALDLLEGHVEALLESGDVEEIRGWYTKFDHVHLMRRPRVAILFAWAFLFAFELEKVRELLELTERGSEELAGMDETTPAHAMAIQIAIASLEDNLEQSLKLTEKWRKAYEASAPLWLLRHVSNTLTFAALYSPDPAVRSQAKSGLQTARFWDDAVPADLPLIYHHCYVARCYLQEGDFASASLNLDQAEQAVARIGEPSINAAFMPMALRGLIQWERGEFESIETTLGDHLEQILKGSTIQVCQDAAVAVARMHCARHNFGKAIDVLDQLIDVVSSPQNSNRRILEVLREKLRVFFFQNNISEAEKTLSHMREIAKSVISKSRFWNEHVRSVIASSEGLVEFARAKYAGVIDKLLPHLEDLDHAGLLYYSAQVRALLTAAYWKTGDKELALHNLAQVLRLGREAQLKWTILDWRPALEPLIRIYVDRAGEAPPRSTDGLSAAYAMSFVLDAKGHANARVLAQIEDLVGTLTEREREIFELVAAGISNKQIAARLSLSTNTVKWHLKHAYEKTGARTRLDAARLARPGHLT